MTTAFATEFQMYQKGDVVLSITSSKNYAKSSY